MDELNEELKREREGKNEDNGQSFAQVNEEDIEELDDEEIEKTLKLPSSFQEVQDDQYPLFLTVKRLLLMIDATVFQSFYYRDKNQKLVQQSQSAQWHNEQNGCMMINSYYKKSEVKKRASGRKMDEDDDLSSDDEIRPDFKESSDDTSSSLKNKDQDQTTGQFLSTEVDFHIFNQKFWPTQ